MLIDKNNAAGILAALAGKGRLDGTTGSGSAFGSARIPATGSIPVDRQLGSAGGEAASTEGEVEPSSGQLAEVGGHADPDGRTHDVASAADQLHESISDLLMADAETVPAGETLILLQTLVRERHRLDAAYLHAVALAEQLDAAASAGGASIQGYLKSTLGISPGRAKADIAAAHAIHGERTKELVPTAAPETGALAPLGLLLSDGAVSLAHVDVGVKTLENIPGRLVCRENLEQITGFLAAHAPSTTPREIRILSDRLIRSLEPDQDDHYDAESFNRRFFTMATDLTGMVHGSYQLDPAAGAELRAILDPLSAPKPDQKNENGDVLARDSRTPGQRRADALGELIRAGSSLLGPAPSADSTAQPGLFQLGESTDSGLQSRAGKLRLSRRQSRITIVTTTDQIQTMRDRRTERAFGGEDVERETFVPVDPTPSHCDQLGPVSPGTLARMSCDGLFERVVLDAKGAVLDLGLAVRLATPAQRRAVAARDQGCIVPGCDRPPAWCEAHHVVWYSRGGPSDVDNFALLCTSDHSRAHAGLLDVKMFDGIPYVRFAHQGGAAMTPLGGVRHPDEQDWIRNGYFDRLKSADAAGRAMLLRTAAGIGGQ